MKRVYQAVMKRKKTSLAALVALAVVAVFTVGPLTKSKAAVRYVTTPATSGTVTTTVSGTGQVDSTQLLSLKSPGSATVSNVAVTKGQHVKAGDLLVQIDTKDAAKAVRDAQVSLESAQLSLEKLKEPPSATSLLAAQNALADSKQKLADLQAPPDSTSLLNAKDAVTAAQTAVDQATTAQDSTKDDALNAVADAHLDLLNTVTSLDSTLNGNDLDPSRGNVNYLENTIYGPERDELLSLATKAQNDYYDAKNSYDSAFDAYVASSRDSDLATTTSLVDQSVDAVKKISESVKSENTLYRYVDDTLVAEGRTVPTGVKTIESRLADLTSTMDSRLSALLSKQSSLANAQSSIDSADRTLAERQAALDDLEKGATQSDIDSAERDVAAKQASLDSLNQGPDPLDLRAQELSVQTRQNALQDAEESLGDYTVVAPFDGVVTDTPVKAGDDVSAGTAVVSVMTNEKLAKVTLNETDVAKVKQGDKAILTFDALPDLSVTGEVASVDVVGTVSQGVVTYGVEIGFDVQDDSVRSGMTVTASIITDVAQNVITVPNAAIKSSGSGSTVQVLENGAPKTVDVQTGLVGDSVTEIKSGVSEGDQVITQTIDPNAKTTAAASTSILGGSRSGGGFSAMGGAMRAVGGGGGGRPAD